MRSTHSPRLNGPENYRTEFGDLQDERLGIG
jgi:hypothetical protein